MPSRQDIGNRNINLKQQQGDLPDSDLFSSCQDVFIFRKNQKQKGRKFKVKVQKWIDTLAETKE